MTVPFLAILDPYSEVADYLADEARAVGFEADWPCQPGPAARLLAARAADAVLIDVSAFGLDLLGACRDDASGDSPLTAILSGSCSEEALEVDAHFCASMGIRVAAVLPKPLVSREIALALECLRLILSGPPLPRARGPGVVEPWRKP
jgi:DNA-binding response OmpR family regulator